MHAFPAIHEGGEDSRDQFCRPAGLGGAGYTHRFHGPRIHSGGHFYLNAHRQSVARRTAEAVAESRPAPADLTPGGHT